MMRESNAGRAGHEACSAKHRKWNVEAGNFIPFLAYENPKNAHISAQKSSQNFKPSIHSVVGTGTNFANKKEKQKNQDFLGVYFFFPLRIV